MSTPIVSRAQVEEAVGKEGADLFYSSAEVLDGDGIAALRKEMDEYVYDLDSVKKLYRNLDVKLAERIGEACRGLLDVSADLSPDQVAAVVGAVRYFVAPGDAQDDVWTERGLDDDARLVNLVIQAAGVPVTPVTID